MVLSRSRRKDADVDRVGHRLVTSAIGVYPVKNGAAYAARRQEGCLQRTGERIASSRVHVCLAVIDVRAADKNVELFAIVVFQLVGRNGRRIGEGGIQRRGNGATDNLDTGGMQTGNNVLITRDDHVGRYRRNIVDTFKPDNVR